MKPYKGILASEPIPERLIAIEPFASTRQSQFASTLMINSRVDRRQPIQYCRMLFVLYGNVMDSTRDIQLFAILFPLGCSFIISAFNNHREHDLG